MTKILVILFTITFSVCLYFINSKLDEVNLLISRQHNYNLELNNAEFLRAELQESLLESFKFHCMQNNSEVMCDSLIATLTELFELNRYKPL